MKDPVIWSIFLGVALSVRIQTSHAFCTKKPTCDERFLEKIEISPIRGPRYYWSPGPIKLSCFASGDVQSIFWKRKRSDGAEQVVQSTELIEITDVSNDNIPSKNATVVNYLLTDKFPYVYHCVAIGKCCNEEKSDPTIVKLSPCRFPTDKCSKDILLILDMSGSIGLLTWEQKIKPFLFRLITDTTLSVSPNGSNLAVMVFSTARQTRLLVTMNEGSDQNLLNKEINNIDYQYESGGETRTDIALKLANQIFKDNSPANNRNRIGDVILLVTDGEPVGAGRDITNETHHEGDKLKNKGVRIIGVRVAQFYPRSTFLKQITTDGQTLETTFDDIENIVDRIVAGVCPQPTAVPGTPKSLKVAVQKDTLSVSWFSQKSEENEFECYIIYWKRNDINDSFNVNITTNPYVVLRTSDGPGAYTVKVQSVNRFGIGKEAYLNNVQVPTYVASTPTLKRETTKISSITTFSMHGSTPSSTDSGKKRGTGDTVVIGAVVGSILLFLFAVVLSLFLRHFIRKRQREHSIQEFESWHESHARTSNSSKSPMLKMERLRKKNKSEQTEISYIVLLKDWEISPRNLKLTSKKLGSGKFGIVKQGLYTPSKNGSTEVVAVKMLKDNARESDFSDLLAELELLKKVNKDPHPNVIRFIGGCSLKGKLLVVTEFCAGGNLRNFLRNSRMDYQNLTSSLNDHQLLKIALDVVNGMVHLSSHKFVHRDLAARNILLGENNLAKVSDFGLARDIGNAEEYVRSNQNLLPVKWMALESLLHGRFTTASDVWSFGILLYECVTLGAEPYQNISSYNIINHVGAGGRMSKPSHCSDEIYKIMKDCWQVSPNDRPTFLQVRKDLDDMLADNEKSHINILQVNDQYLQTTIYPNNKEITDGQNNA